MPAKKLDAERLAAAIERALGDSAMQRRAAELSQALRREDGVGRASEQIEATLAGNQTGLAFSHHEAASAHDNRDRI